MILSGVYNPANPWIVKIAEYYTSIFTIVPLIMRGCIGELQGYQKCALDDIQKLAAQGNYAAQYKLAEWADFEGKHAEAFVWFQKEMITLLFHTKLKQRIKKDCTNFKSKKNDKVRHENISLW